MRKAYKPLCLRSICLRGGGSVQQGLSAAFEVAAYDWHRGAADKRYSLSCTMREPNDWRLTNQERHLKGVTLLKRSYEPASEDNDHDHCEFCCVKFMTAALPETIQVGYSTPNGYWWVCPTCYEDFADLFDWEVSGEA